MIPLILHHRIVDPFDTTLTACAEEWHRDMNARLIYDFILLVVLFILPLTLMTYCYIRISFSLWFIDSNIQTPLSSSISHIARYSTISEENPHEIKRKFSQASRPHLIQYQKANEPQASRALDDSRSLFLLNHQRRNTMIHDQHSSLFTPRRYSEADSISKANHIQLNIQARSSTSRPRRSISQYTSGLLQTSMTSLPGQHRITYQHRSLIDLEHTNRFLRSRRRVVKLLITLGRLATSENIARAVIDDDFSSDCLLSHSTSFAYPLDLHRYHVEYLSAGERLWQWNEIRLQWRCCGCVFFVRRQNRQEDVPRALSQSNLSITVTFQLCYQSSLLLLHDPCCETYSHIFPTENTARTEERFVADVGSVSRRTYLHKSKPRAASRTDMDLDVAHSRIC